MPGNGKYTDEEVRKILDRALRGAPDSGMSHDELVAIASEVGVSRAAIDTAARQLQRDQASEQGRQLVLRRRRGRLATHAFTFALVNAFLFVINYLTTPGEWWVLFPVFSWGLALAFHARFALSGEVSARALLKEQRRMAHEERYDDLAEKMELAALTDMNPSSTNPTLRTRVDATPPEPAPEIDPEPAAEHAATKAEASHRRD